MALETLRNVQKIGGFTVVHMDRLRDEKPELFDESGAMNWKMCEEKIRPKNFIYVRGDKNSLSFTLQNGPIKEHGVNGCQVDTVIEAAKIIIEKLNDRFPCHENSKALTKLDEALMWLRERTRRRTVQGIEGTNKERSDA